MELIVSKLVSVIVTGAILLVGLLLALWIGNISGKLLRKILGIGGN